MSHRKTVILFQTHFINDFVLDGFARIRETCSAAYDVIFLYDTTHAGPKQKKKAPPGSFMFDWQTLKKQAYCPFHKSSKVIPPHARSLLYKKLLKAAGFKEARDVNYQMIPGNRSFALFYFFEKHPEYQHYWLVEYDAWWTGNWQSFFDAFAASKADLLTTRLEKYRKGCPGLWWNTLKRPGLTRFLPLPSKSRVFGFLPICRFSRKALDYLIKKNKAGWSGHQEVLIPSLLYRGGFKLEDIGGKGPFVAPSNRERFYTFSGFFGTRSPGKFLYSKAGPRLLHPVKDTSLLQPVSPGSA